MSLRLALEDENADLVFSVGYVPCQPHFHSSRAVERASARAARQCRRQVPRERQRRLRLRRNRSFERHDLWRNRAKYSMPETIAIATTSQSADAARHEKASCRGRQDQKRDGDDLREHLGLSPARGGDHDPLARGDRAQARHRELPSDDDHDHPGRREAELDERDQRRRDQRACRRWDRAGFPESSPDPAGGRASRRRSRWRWRSGR